MRFLFYSCLLVLVSCSTQKQWSRLAKTQVLQDSALLTAHVGISVYEPAIGKYWFNYQGDKYFVPASNTKIPTCYAAMKYLSDSLVAFRYARKDQVLLLRPSGDPSFCHPDFRKQPALDFLRSDDASMIIWQPNHFKTTPWGNGWSWNDYDENYMAERSPFPINGNLVVIRDTAHTFPKIRIDRSPIRTAYQQGYRIERNLAGNFSAAESSKPFTETKMPFVAEPIFISKVLTEITGKPTSPNMAFLETPNAWELLYSRPTDSMLRPMMHRSDNFFAEQSLLMVSNELFGVMQESLVIDSIMRTDFKDLPQKPRWADGSGLSRYNLFTPQSMVAILDKMQKEFGMDRIRGIFPSGNEGTLSNYYRQAQGSLYAKTGTLSGVVALSGYLVTKQNKLLIFSVLVNNHQASATAVRRAVEKFILELREKG